MECDESDWALPIPDPDDGPPLPAVSAEPAAHFPVIEPCNPNPEPVPPGKGTSLGIASYPPETCMRDATMYKWTAPTIRPSSYRMGYALSSAEAAASKEEHRGYASATGATWLSENQWAWRPPAGCTDPWSCLYTRMMERDRALLHPIAQKFRERADASRLTSAQVAELVLRFVQSIQYEAYKDASEPFGVRTPALVARQRAGDCDSKALLGLILLRDLGIDAVIISSAAHAHALLGIAVPAAGRSFTYKGRRYAYAECAATSSPVGYISPKLLKPDDWRVIEIAGR